MARHDVNATANTNKYRNQVADFESIAKDIEESLTIYNKLNMDTQSKWLAKDVLLASFIALAAKVKR